MLRSSYVGQHRAELAYDAAPASRRRGPIWAAVGAVALGAGIFGVAWNNSAPAGPAATATLTTPTASASASATASAEAAKSAAPTTAQPATSAAAAVHMSPLADPVDSARPVGLTAARQYAWQAPVDPGIRVSSGFGHRWGRTHAGLDFAGSVGTPVHAVAMGEVTFAGPAGGYGNKVEVTLWDGTVVYYAHLSRMDVRVGQEVDTGQQVGAIGNTGNSTGPHLHFEVHPQGGPAVDPLPWLTQRDIQP